jgi:phage gpG-like protein
MATSFEIVVDNTDEVLRKLDENTEAALEACGIQAVGHAQDIIDANVPRHSGSWYTSKGAAGLRGSISHEVHEDTCYVGTNNEYAIYNEVGTGIYAEGGKGRQSPWAYKDDKGNWHRTRGITPLHFLKNALSKNIDEYRKIFIEYLSR